MKYGTYKMRLHRSTDRVSCHLCDSEVRRPLDHVRHVHGDHGLKNKTHCPWCYEPFEERGAEKNAAHLSSCFAQLVRYDRCVRQAKFKVTCCETFLARDYVHHVYSVHGLDKNSDCPWCEGRKDMSLSHRMTCLERRIEQHKKQKNPPKVVCEPCIEFDSPRESLNFYGRDRLRGVHPSFYEPFPDRPWLAEEEEAPRVRFDDPSGLGADAPLYVARFRATAKDYYWRHLFISAMAYESFYEALQQTRSVHLLPFSCLCSGGDKRYEPAYRHHRHCIVVSPSKKAFHQMWRHVKFSVRRYERQNCKSNLEIKTTHHLCNVMNYVGGRKSMCKGIDFYASKNRKQPDYNGKTKKKHHYHIFRPFCLHASRYLHMCYKEGPQQFMEQRHGQWEVWNMESLKWEGKRAYVEIRDLPGELDHGCRPPLAPDLMECEDEIVVTAERVVVVEPFVGLWTLEGRPVYLTKRDPPGSKRDYFERGSAVDPSLRYFLTRSQKKTAKQLHLDRERARDRLEREMGQKEKEKQVMRSEKDREIEKLLSENAALREKMDREVGHVHQLMDMKDDFYRQINELRAEKDAAIHQLRAEKDAALESKDREIKRLMVDRLAEVVRHHLENRDISDRERRSLMRHHAATMRQMEEKLDLKDKICFLWEQLVSTWLAVDLPPRKRTKFK